MFLDALVPAFTDELTKIAAELTPQSRSEIKTKYPGLEKSAASIWEKMQILHHPAAKMMQDHRAGFAAASANLRKKPDEEPMTSRQWGEHVDVQAKTHGLTKTAGWLERSPELLRYLHDSIRKPGEQERFREGVGEIERDNPEVMAQIGRPLLEKSAESRDWSRAYRRALGA